MVVNSSEGHVYTGPLENGHWVDASNLKAGDRLLNHDESWAEVVSVEQVTEPLKAYNLTVEDFHTYFIAGAANDNAANNDAANGNLTLAKAVWVHNDCFDDLPSGSQATGIKNVYGQETYIGPDGESLYKGHDGRFYNAEIHPPTQPLPVNPRMKSDKWLKNQNIDPHDIKGGVQGSSRQDVYVDKKGNIYVVNKGAPKDAEFEYVGSLDDYR